MSAPRIALVGARRVHQGLGPFVARFLGQLGAEVPAILGTSSSSVAEAQRELERDAGLEPAGYTSLEDMLAAQTLDAIAILSPAETHERYLRAALAAELHVLCEKPLLWGGDRLAERAQELAEGFDEAGLLLFENCQWPYALPAFRALHPESEGEPLETFRMRLSPASHGAQMIGDALPHPLSVLQALVPGDPLVLEGIEFSDPRPDAEEQVVRFDFVTDEARVACRIDLIAGNSLPREAGLTLNGRVARRRVRMDDYALFLADDAGREVPLPDPLHALLTDFVLALGRAREGRLQGARQRGHVPDRMALLAELLSAFRRASR